MRTAKPIALMAAGLLVLGAAAVTGVMATRSAVPTPTPRPAIPIASTRPLTLTPSDFAMVTVDYDPGQSSGWHLHPGIHAVHVLSGTLTVYGDDCVPRRFSAGESYVGGRDPHLARNETAEPVRMAITYVEPGNPVPADLAFAIPAPPGCPAGR